MLSPIGSFDFSPPAAVLDGRTVIAALDDRAQSVSSTTAYVCGTDSITYGELVAAVRNRGAALRRVHAGDRTGRAPLAVVVDASVDTVISMLAVLASGHPLFAVDVDLPQVARAAIVSAAGAVPVATVAFEFTPENPVEDDGVWWESPAWDRGLTEGGRPTALDAWRPAMIVLGPGETGRVTVMHEDLLTAAIDLATRAGLEPGTTFDVSHPMSSMVGVTALTAGLVSGCTVGAPGRGFATAG